MEATQLPFCRMKEEHGFNVNVMMQIECDKYVKVLLVARPVQASYTPLKIWQPNEMNKLQL